MTVHKTYINGSLKYNEAIYKATKCDKKEVTQIHARLTIHDPFLLRSKPMFQPKT